MNTLRQNILQALTAFVNSRPGLEFGNYGDVSTYRSEMRSITKDRAQALEMLSNVAWRENAPVKMTGDDIRKTAARELSRSIATRWFR